MAKKLKPGITVYIICGNFEKDIAPCLHSVLWADNIIINFANSSDNSERIASTIAPNAIFLKSTDEYNKNFSVWRNLGLKFVSTQWLFYLDTDEIVSSDLKDEIINTLKINSSHSAYVIPRANYYLQKRVHYGGSSPDYVKRIFYMPKFRGFSGILHEQPLFSGSLGYLKNELVHNTHKDFSSMLNKSIVWTDSQSQLLFEAHHPPVVWWRILRMMFTKFFQRGVLQKMFLDGSVGQLSVIFETYDTFMIYARLWELQIPVTLHES